MSREYTARIIARLFTMLCVLLLIAGCSLGSDSSQVKNSSGSGERAASTGHENLVRSYGPSTRVIVTRSGPSLPDGCRPRQVAGLVTSFFHAFNEGDQERLSRFFVPEGPPGPGLFGSGNGPGKGFGTRDRDELLKYFARRHEHKEQLRLLEIDVGKSGRPDGAAIAFNLTRTADDIEPGLGGPKNVAIGKGEIDCGEQRFVVWNMVMAEARFLDKQGMPPSICPEPSRQKPGREIISCARKEG